MAVNYIDYDVLHDGEKSYATQAATIRDVISSIKKMNDALMQGWSNETARAFVQRIDTDHIDKLEKASAALDEVSMYIKNYLANKQDEDTQGAGAISG